MGKEMTITSIRDKYINDVTETLENFFEAEKIVTGSGEIAFPIVDDEGNELYLKIQFSIPRGTRNGTGGYTPYNAYDEAEAYKFILDEKAEKKAQREREKQRKEEEKERKREAKKQEREAAKLAKKLATKGLQGVIHEGIEETKEKA